MVFKPHNNINITLERNYKTVTIPILKAVLKVFTKTCPKTEPQRKVKQTVMAKTRVGRI